MKAPRETTTPKTLTWRTVDEYHAVTVCKRYSIARVSLSGAHRYEAWLWSPSTLIGFEQLEAGASDDDRAAARAKLRDVCAAHAAGVENKSYSPTDGGAKTSHTQTAENRLVGAPRSETAGASLG